MTPTSWERAIDSHTPTIRVCLTLIICIATPRVFITRIHVLRSSGAYVSLHIRHGNTFITIHVNAGDAYATTYVNGVVYDAAGANGTIATA